MRASPIDNLERRARRTLAGHRFCFPFGVLGLWWRPHKLVDPLSTVLGYSNCCRLQFLFYRYWIHLQKLRYRVARRHSLKNISSFFSQHGRLLQPSMDGLSRLDVWLHHGRQFANLPTRKCVFLNYSIHSYSFLFIS